MQIFLGDTSVVHPSSQINRQAIEQIITRFEKGTDHSSTVHGVMDSNSEVSLGPGPDRWRL
jgi:hypothetical protein